MGFDFGYLKEFRKRFLNRKLYSLIDKVYDIETLREAWKRVYSNRGCAGVDKVTIREFKRNEERYLQELHMALKTGRYTPPPVLRKYIPKKDGLRPLGIPTVKDRVAQQVVKMVLEPVFESKFLECSYGYRTKRNAHQAIRKLRHYRTQKNYRWIVDGDIKGFFDNVDHEIMISLVAKEISDGRILDLISKWLKAGVMKDGKEEQTEIGTPQGGVISPLLANIYLHEFDRYMIERKFNLIRYADDFVIICSTEKRAKKALAEVKKVLAKLKLQLHPEKTRIVHTEEIQFLGFIIGGNNRRRMRPRREAITKFKGKIKVLTKRHKTIPAKDIVRQMNALISGWGHYYKIGTVTEVFRKLDIYLRKRLRIYIEKKISEHSHQRLSNHTLWKEYGLKSLTYLLKLYQQNSHPV